MKRILLTATCLLIPCAVLADDRLSILQSQPANKQDIAKLEYKVAELEREVRGKNGKGGIKKQVNILHAKVDALEAKAK